MNDREKLIQILKEVEWNNIDVSFIGYKAKEIIADHLIANGVVIQKQGEWVKETETYGRTFYRCSRCNTTSQYGRTKQCKYCRAKMKEVK